MSPRPRSHPDRPERRPRPPGEVDGWDGLTRDGGRLTATCGGCGMVVTVEVPSGNRRPATLGNNALARAGWTFVPTWGWIERTCLRSVRKGVKAGHVQLAMF